MLGLIVNHVGPSEKYSIKKLKKVFEVISETAYSTFKSKIYEKAVHFQSYVNFKQASIAIITCNIMNNFTVHFSV